MLVRRIHDSSACEDMGQIKRHCVVSWLNGRNMAIHPEACLQRRRSYQYPECPLMCAHDAAIRIHVEFDVIELRSVGDLEEVSGGGSELDFGEYPCPL